MSLRRGISELYVDVALTLVVLSVAGVLVASYGNLGRSLSMDLKDYEVAPLALIIDYYGRRYLIVVNYVDAYMELVLVGDNVRLGSITLGPKEVRVIDITSLITGEFYVISHSHVFKPEVAVLR